MARRHSLLAWVVSLACVPAFAQPAFHVMDGVQGMSSSTPESINADGSVVVGHMFIANVSGGVRAARWVPGVELINLNTPQGGFGSFATGVSWDGRVVVGRQGTRGFRWTPEDGLELLPDLPGTTSTSPEAVSPDGRVVVGTAAPGTPFVWSRLRGMVDLKANLPLQGVDTDGWQILTAVGVSMHGYAIVGEASRAGQSRGYRASGISWWCVADIDDGSGTGQDDQAVTIDDLLYYLTLFERGDPNADFDDGSFTGLVDRAVTIDDLLFFLQRFSKGC